MPASQSTVAESVAAAQDALGSAFASAAITPPTTMGAAQQLTASAANQVAEAHTLLVQLEADGVLAEHDHAAFDTVHSNVLLLHGRLASAAPAADADERTIRDALIVAQQAASLQQTFAERQRVFSDCMNHGGARAECATSAVSLVPVPMELAVRISGQNWVAVGLGLALLTGAVGLAIWGASRRMHFLDGLNNPRPERITARPSKRFKKRYDLEVDDAED